MFLFSSQFRYKGRCEKDKHDKVTAISSLKWNSMYSWTTKENVYAYNEITDLRNNKWNNREFFIFYFRHFIREAWDINKSWFFELYWIFLIKKLRADRGRKALKKVSIELQKLILAKFGTRNLGFLQVFTFSIILSKGKSNWVTF